MRQNRFAAAIAAFDRASDPVVQEDAAYWAAVAAYRAGHRDAARRRFTDFLARFPESPRVDAARRALDVWFVHLVEQSDVDAELCRWLAV